MKFISWLFFCVTSWFSVVSGGGGGGGGHHKVIIHVPYHVKTIKHTHTIYKTIHHQDHGHGGGGGGGGGHGHSHAGHHGWHR